MEKIKEVLAGGFYYISGNSCGNSSIFEDELEALYFLRKTNERFRGYLRVHAHSLMQDSWHLLCELECKDLILKTYQEKRKQSKKAQVEHELKEIWRIISEQFRHFLSQYVKWVNRKRNRKGSLRMESYRRYLLDSEEEGEFLFTSMKNRELKNSQDHEEYKSSKAHWRIENEEMCEVLRSGIEKIGYLVVEGACKFVALTIDVLRQSIKSTFEIHKHQKDKKSSLIVKK